MCSSTTSGLRLKSFDLENSGKINSSSPTLVVLKVPLEVSQVSGAYLFLCGMFFRSFFVIKIRSPSEPESSRTRQAFVCGCCFLIFFMSTTVAATTALIPSPLTTCFRFSNGFSTILIGVLLVIFKLKKLLFSFSTLNLLLLKLILRSQHPISYSLSEEEEELLELAL